MRTLPDDPQPPITLRTRRFKRQTTGATQAEDAAESWEVRLESAALFHWFGRGPIDGSLTATHQVIADPEWEQKLHRELAALREQHRKETSQRSLKSIAANRRKIDRLRKPLESHHKSTASPKISQQVGRGGKAVKVARQTISGSQCVSKLHLIPQVEPAPKGKAYLTLGSNYWKNDLKLRFVPYFGEHDDLQMDESIYDSDSDIEVSEADCGAAADLTAKYGCGRVVQELLSTTLNVPFATIVEHIAMSDSHKAKLERKVEAEREKLRQFGSDLSDMDQMQDSFETLFCRRCYIYHCRLHGTDQPRKQGLRLPVDSLLRRNLPKYIARFASNAAPEESTSETHCPSLENCFLRKPAAPGTAKSSWGVVEQALFRKLLLVHNRNFCRIATVLGTKTCLEVSQFAASLNVRDARTESSCLDAEVDAIKKKPSTKYKRNQYSHVRSSGTVHAYTPCDHPGPCTDPATCICVRQNTFCAKYCACPSDSCRRLFLGCQCRGCQCLTRSCPCLASNRECDPDLCLLCTEHSGAPSQDRDRHCKNNSIRRSQKQQILIGPSRLHGWGAFAADDIARNELISEYLGEVISQEEADRRGRVYDKLECSYLFNLDEELVVDAARKGNKLKFLNHSDTPNCLARIMQVNGDHRIGVYAQKNIRRGAELCFHYNHRSAGSAPSWFQNPNCFRRKNPAAPSDIP